MNEELFDDFHFLRCLFYIALQLVTGLVTNEINSHKSLKLNVKVYLEP